MQDLERFLSLGFNVCVIIRGLPGRGKTHLAHSLSSSLSRLSFSSTLSSADDYLITPSTLQYEYHPSLVSHAHNQCLKSLITSMQLGIRVVVQHNTNIKEWESQALRQNAYALGYLVYLIEPPFAFSLVEEIPVEFRFKNAHGVEDCDIEVMRKQYMQINNRYFAYWLTTDSFLRAIETRCSVQSTKSFLGEAILTLKSNLHLTTDFVAEMGSDEIFELQREAGQITELNVRALFKHENGMGALITGVDGSQIPRYRRVSIEDSTTVSSHLTLAVFNGAESYETGLHAHSVSMLLDNVSSPLVDSVIMKQDGYEIIAFTDPLIIPSIFSPFYSNTDINKHAHFAWTFTSSSDQSVFIHLLSLATILTEQPLDASTSPDGRTGWILADMKSAISGVREDLLFDSNAFMRQHLTRGLVYLVDPEKRASVVLRGLCKFTGIEDPEEEPEKQTKKEVKPSDKSDLYALKPLSSCATLQILVTEKANGEAAHIRVLKSSSGAYLILSGSKNVHLLFPFTTPSVIDTYSADRYTYARQISHTFIAQYPPTNPSTRLFLDFMSKNEWTGCFEYEDPAHQHIIPLLARQLKFITFSSSALQSNSYCAMDPVKALGYMRSLGFLCVASHTTTSSDLPETRREILFEWKDVEGAVVYHVERSTGNVLLLQKLKNGFYILSRAVREKVCGFIGALEKSLGAFDEKFEGKMGQVSGGLDGEKRMRCLEDLVGKTWINYEKKLVIEGSKRKLRDRIREIVRDDYVPLNQVSVDSWEKAGSEMMREVSAAFLVPIKTCFDEWKQMEGTDQSQLWQSTGVQNTLTQEEMRNEWPSRFLDVTRRFPTLVESNKSNN